jgi:hypothetical protein
MQAIQLHDDRFLKIFWEEKVRIVRLDWKDSTSAMTGEEFKRQLTLFAGHARQNVRTGFLQTQVMNNLLRETSHERQRTNVLD